MCTWTLPISLLNKKKIKNQACLLFLSLNSNWPIWSAVIYLIHYISSQFNDILFFIFFQFIWVEFKFGKQTNGFFMVKKILQVDLIYYRNVRDATLIVDLRTRVNLGGGLYHFNDIWNDLVNDKDCDYYTFFYRRETNGDDHHNLIFISATCCGSSIYFLVPEIVLRCPICDSFVHRWDIIRVVMFWDVDDQLAFKVSFIMFVLPPFFFWVSVSVFVVSVTEKSFKYCCVRMWMMMINKLWNLFDTSIINI